MSLRMSGIQKQGKRVVQNAPGHQFVLTAMPDVHLLEIIAPDLQYIVFKYGTGMIVKYKPTGIHPVEVVYDGKTVRKFHVATVGAYANGPTMGDTCAHTLRMNCNCYEKSIKVQIYGFALVPNGDRDDESSRMSAIKNLAEKKFSNQEDSIKRVLVGFVDPVGGETGRQCVYAIRVSSEGKLSKFKNMETTFDDLDQMQSNLRQHIDSQRRDHAAAQYLNGKLASIATKLRANGNLIVFNVEEAPVEG
eukprot:234229_1